MSMVRRRAISLGILALLAMMLTCVLLASLARRHLKQQAERAEDVNLCQNHDFPTWPNNSRKVFDLVLLHNELEWLEIRLHTLASQVDYFVILESNTTFTGHPKELSLEKHWDRFKPFHKQIIYHKVEENARQYTAESTWAHEADLRNSMLTKVFPQLEGSAREAQEGDVIMVSDVDEIPRPETVRMLRRCQFPHRVTLRSEFYYYAFQWRHQGVQWHHPQATTFSGNVNDTIPPEALRNGHEFGSWPADSTDIWNAGWHCSSCFDTIAQVQEKIRSFSHTEHNLAEHNDPHTIIHRYEHGLDLFARPGELYEEVFTSDLPAYIKERHELEGRFGYLLNRTQMHAGFLDADVMLHLEPQRSLSGL